MSVDKLYCKTELAWITSNAKQAQEHLTDDNLEKADEVLSFLERAVTRVRDHLARSSP